MLPIDQCRDRKLYRVTSRNLTLAVFVADTKHFLGLREKFGYVFVDEEFHYELGGTVRPTEELDATVPDTIPLVAILKGVVCGTCKTEVVFDAGAKMWVHGEGVVCDKARPFSQPNKKLDAWLKRQEKKYRRVP